MLQTVITPKVIRRTVFYIFMTVIAFIWLIPVLIVLFTALKSNPDLYSRGLFVETAFSMGTKKGTNDIENGYQLSGIRLEYRYVIWVPKVHFPTF